MSIDGVTKGPAPSAGLPGTSSVQGKTATDFSVAAKNPVSPTEAVWLDRVRSGEVDVGTYLDHKIDEAMAHLQALPSERTAHVREMLRAELLHDPLLADLIKQATGRSVPDLGE